MMDGMTRLKQRSAWAGGVAPYGALNGPDGDAWATRLMNAIIILPYSA
jgi:hypothetical protein